MIPIFHPNDSERVIRMMPLSQPAMPIFIFVRIYYLQGEIARVLVPS